MKQKFDIPYMIKTNYKGFFTKTFDALSKTDGSTLAGFFMLLWFVSLPFVLLFVIPGMIIKDVVTRKLLSQETVDKTVQALEKLDESQIETIITHLNGYKPQSNSSKYLLVTFKSHEMKLKLFEEELFLTEKENIQKTAMQSFTTGSASSPVQHVINPNYQPTPSEREEIIKTIAPYKQEAKKIYYNSLKDSIVFFLQDSKNNGKEMQHRIIGSAEFVTKQDAQTSTPS